MSTFEKFGYLENDFKMFHILDRKRKEFAFHYHDFNKIIIFIKGNINYTIEGKNYSLKPYDIVLVNAGEIHRPSVLDDSEYERIITSILKLNNESQLGNDTLTQELLVQFPKRNKKCLVLDLDRTLWYRSFQVINKPCHS